MLIRVVPRSSQSKVTVGDGELKVYTHAPPADGEANDAVVALLSKVLRVPKAGISIVSGKSSRRKRILVDGLDDQEIMSRVMSQ